VPPDGTYLSNPNGDDQSATNTLKILSPNLLGIMDTVSVEGSAFGLGIATGLTETGGKKSLVLYPVGTDKTATECYASLGSSGNLWNVFANIIDCAGLNTAGYLAAKTIYMNNELVAT